MIKRHLVIASVAVLLSLAVPIVGVWLVHRPLPVLDGRQSLSGLGADVAVRFDGRAVPYIESRSDADAYIAQGFATARDRMFQMDMLRRSALGELSEVYGASSLPSDRLMHTLGISKLAYAEYNHLSEPAKAALDAYARGVNEYLNTSSGNLPLQFAFLGYTPRAWRPEDSLAIWKYRAYKLDESWRLDDFRQRVANKVGNGLATQLFRDDLVDYALPPAPEATKSPTPQPDAAGSTSTRSGTVHDTAKRNSADNAVPHHTTEQHHTDTTGPHHTTEPGHTDATGMHHAPEQHHSDATGPQGANRRPPADSSHGSGGREPARGSNEPLGLNSPVDKLLTALATESDVAHKSMGVSALAGSTTWAVPSGASASGGALLACNSDGPLNSPSDWYVCSLNSPGLHVAGVCIPGVPGIILGRNEDVCWGASALKADVQDIFLEQFKSQFDLNYKAADGWKLATVETELISSRFGKDVEHKVVTTAHGPVLLRHNDMAVSLSWTGFNTEHPSFEALYKLNRASSIDQCMAALSTFSDPPTMFVFADRWGNIACHAAGDIPVRAGGGTGTQLTPGWLTKGSWQSIVPFDKLPESLVTATATTPARQAAKDPIIAANQAPATTGNALPQATRAVMLGHQWAPPYRANRILAALIGSKTAITMADMVALAGDQYTQLAAVLTPTLSDATVATHAVDRNAIYAVDLLARWDGQMRADAIEAAMYEAFMQTLGRRLVEPKLGRDLTTEYMQRWPLWLTFAQSSVQNKPDEWLAPEERNYDTFFITTLTQALKSLRITCDTSSPMEWVWGRVHQATFDPVGANGSWFAPLYRIGPIAVGGTSECINSCDVACDPAALVYAASNGPTQRMIVDMHDHNQFYQCINSGQSAQLASEYQQDQLKSWATVDYFPVAFSPEQLMKQEKHRLTLTDQQL